MASFDEVVPPGKAGSIRASVHTTTYRGPISKQVTVEHDDKSQGPVQLTLSANIVGSVATELFPSHEMVMGMMPGGTSFTP